MIPSFKDYFYPYVNFLSDGEWHKISDIRNYIATVFSLTQEELKEQTKSGHLRHNDRVSWTTTYLKKLKLVEYSRQDGYRLTADCMKLFNELGDQFCFNTVRDLDGFCQLQTKQGSDKGYWVPGHWTSTGRYIAGYVSQWEYKGRQRRFTKEELDAFNEAKKQEKLNKKNKKHEKRN